MEEERASTVKNLFQDISGRRIGIIKALTRDVKEFDRKCRRYLNQKDDDKVFLYGLPNGKWRVSTAARMAADRRPEPALGINLTRDDRMEFEEWLCLVAAFSDAWLLSLAFYIGASDHSLNRAERQSLFNMINDLPTIAETLNGIYKSTKPPTKGRRKTIMRNVGSCEKKPKRNEREFWNSAANFVKHKCPYPAATRSINLNHSTIRKVTFKEKCNKTLDDIMSMGGFF